MILIDDVTRTSIKISFPALKHELFVNFLGYKEPNLVYLWRFINMAKIQKYLKNTMTNTIMHKKPVLPIKGHLY